jgi:serine/threonine-protein kinase RsbW
MANKSDRLLLRVPAQPESVALIRRAVGGRAQEYGLRGRGIDDLKTVVSEACANVVLHAYSSDAEQRPLEVELTRAGNAVEMIVRDHGRGLQPDLEAKRPSLRLGLLLIGAVAGWFQLRSSRGCGTEVAVRFALPPA